MRTILVFDIGTTAVKAALFDERLSLISSTIEEYTLITQGESVIELAPETYWEALKKSLRRLLADHALAQSIYAVTVTTQGETLIPVDANGNALRNAIIWLDGRAENQGAYITKRVTSQEFYETTGLPECNGYCPVSKALWIKENEPDVYSRTHKLLLLEDFILLKLTGRFVTEKTLLSSTGYFDIVRDRYWKDMLDMIGIDAGMFPAPLEPGTPVSRILPEIADELGLNREVMVITGAMDQMAAAVGAGNLMPGVVTEVTGTALIIAATTEKPDFTNPARVTIYRHVLPGKYLVIPICMTAGMVLKWFKDAFCFEEFAQSEREHRPAYDILSELAQKAPRLSNGLTLLPYFTGVLQPDNNPAARGVFFGVGLDTQKPHFIRAIFEGVAYMLRENLELLHDMGIVPEEIRSLGGGSKSTLWLQIKADVTRLVIARMQEAESTALGAAILAGFGSGMVANIESAAQSANSIEHRYLADKEAAQAYDGGYRTYRELYSRLKSLF